jgi:hypothetical protein
MSLPPSDMPVPTNAQVRNRKRKRARPLKNLQSITSALQKNHIARLGEESTVLKSESKRTKGDLSSEISEYKFAKYQLQNIAQSTTLDAYIATRTAENLVRTIVEKDRVIDSLTSASASSPSHATLDAYIATTEKLVRTIIQHGFFLSSSSSIFVLSLRRTHM